jgi:hypothetical protein
MTRSRYASDEEWDLVTIPPDRLAELLAHWGIDVHKMEKTEQDMKEMELTALEQSFFRERLRIPKNATHFVFAYQLEPWKINDGFTRLEQLKQHSGEISLASYGGFIYFIADQTDPSTGHVLTGQVCGANAFSLISHSNGRPQFKGGTIDRKEDDDSITAAVASPELFAGKKIGLESDVFSFGVVAWEVFTRREAWHWLSGKHKRFTIQDRVTQRHKRPRCPDGLHRDCAELVRRCLHQDPSGRPDARDLSKRIGELLTKLRKSMADKEKTKVTERSMSRSDSKSNPTACRARSSTQDPVQWSIVEELTNACWRRGRYSHHRFVADEKTSKLFSLEINAEHQGQWEENALVGDEPAYEPRVDEAGADENPVPVQRLGLTFKNKDGINMWPRVTQISKKISKRRTIASDYRGTQELQQGCQLKSINGVPVESCTDVLRVTAEFAFYQTETVGGIFKNKDGNTWPCLKAIKPGTLLDKVERLTVGSKLVKVNADVVQIGQTLEDYKPALQARPLSLEFEVPIAVALQNGDLTGCPLPLKLEFTLPNDTLLVRPWPTSKWAGVTSSSKLPKWVRAGLEGIRMVRKHEAQSERATARRHENAQRVRHAAAAGPAALLSLQQLTQMAGMLQRDDPVRYEGYLAQTQTQASLRDAEGVPPSPPLN